jgi:membrane protease YdiL (CAAX protease family)
VSPQARFCRHCGADQKPALAALEQRRRSDRHHAEWLRIRALVWFYAIYLASVLPLYWLPQDLQAGAMLVIGGIDAVLIIGYWRLSGTRLAPALRPARHLVRPALIGCALLLVLMPLNYGYHALLIWLFAVDPALMHSVSEPFEAAGYGLGIQLFCIALMPAVWEEIAFRGLVQDHLGQVTGRTEALWLTAALFAIIHAQWLSMPYLFLMGVVLGHLRQRSGSLLPGMLLHGAHNALVVLW